jgi:NADPH:quinone reductase-like Zn-dependent oxidoreductase
MFACQLAKHVFKAGKVITTVSTSKVSKVKELLGDNTVDKSKPPSITPILIYVEKPFHAWTTKKSSHESSH